MLPYLWEGFKIGIMCGPTHASRSRSLSNVSPSVDLWSGRWESNPRPKLGKLILRRENARIGGISASFDVPQMDPNWSSSSQRFYVLKNLLLQSSRDLLQHAESRNVLLSI